jgi:putative transposase
MEISVNALLKWHTEEEKASIDRVLYVSQPSNIVVTINVLLPTALPVTHQYTDIFSAIQNLDASIITQEPLALPQLPDEPSSDCKARIYKHWQTRVQKALMHRNAAWEVIEPIVSRVEIFDSDERGKLIKERVKSCRISKVMVYHYLRCYWRYGMVKDALLPHYPNSGGKGKQREPKAKKLGRPNEASKTGGDAGVNVDRHIRHKFFVGTKKFYSNSKKYPLRTVYRKILAEYFIDNDKGINDNHSKLSESIHVPTFRQFRYWFEHYGNPLEALRKRLGERRYQRTIHVPLSNVTDITFGPGECFEVDATIADTYLVSSLNPCWIIGRPVIYIVKDVFSRLVVGFSITLEGPSWLGAMLALENAVANKVTFCREHGIEITEDQWPSHHLPKRLRADRGEFEGYNADNLVDGLNIKVQNTAPYRPEWKAIIERDFGLCNERFIHFIPGSVRALERGDNDYRLQACLTLRDMRQLMIYRILEYNHSHSLEDYDLDEDMIRDCVPTYPIDLWRWGIKNRVGCLRTLPIDQVRKNLLYKAEGSVTRDGIRFTGLRYTCTTAKKDSWFVKARLKGSWKIPIFYDPRCIDIVFFRHSSGDMEECYLLDREKAFRKRSLYEVEDYAAYKRKERLLSQSSEILAAISFDRKIDEIVNRAAERQKTAMTQSKSESKSARLRGMRPYRQREREMERQTSAWFSVETQELSLSPVLPETETMLKANPPEQQQPITSATRFDTIRRIRNEQKEGNHEQQ